MQGRRLYRLENQLFEKSNGSLLPAETRLWDYWQEYDGTWFAYSPAGVGSLAYHEVTEHRDGTITVGPAILRSGTSRWQGSIEHGEWREGS